MPFDKYNSIFSPEELAPLQRVFDQLCQERTLTLAEREQREWLASQIIEAYRDGVTEEAELCRLLSARHNADAGG